MPSSIVTYFNSIKVQLKRFGQYGCRHFDRFQFHKGTIKTQWRIVYHTDFEKFQFHKGTIKTGWR